jgi:protein SCO1
MPLETNDPQPVRPETRSPRQRPRLLWPAVGLAITLLLLTALVGAMKLRMTNAQPLPVYGKIADFTLTNQLGRTVTLADLTGKVWVADVIFTRCAGPCPKMTRQMKALQTALPAGSDARLVTLTTDPDYDTPPILQQYAQRFGADPQRWLFLTGPKQQIANLAVGSLKLSALPKSTAEQQSPVDLFVHSTIFVVVDKHAQLRGIFETTGEGVDPAQTQRQILAAVRQLEGEG